MVHKSSLMIRWKEALVSLRGHWHKSYSMPKNGGGPGQGFSISYSTFISEMSTVLEMFCITICYHQEPFKKSRQNRKLMRLHLMDGHSQASKPMLSFWQYCRWGKAPALSNLCWMEDLIAVSGPYKKIAPKPKANACLGSLWLGIQSIWV